MSASSLFVADFTSAATTITFLLLLLLNVVGTIYIHSFMHSFNRVRSPQAFGSVIRLLSGVDDATRDALRAEVLSTTIDDIRLFGEILSQALALEIAAHELGTGVVSASVTSAMDTSTSDLVCSVSADAQTETVLTFEAASVF